MRMRSLGRGLLLPGALVVLVGILAAFQYHWLGQLSRAERERLQKSLARQADDFADAFDSELLWIELALQSGGPVRPEAPDPFAQAFDRWREKARYPRLIRSVYLVDAAPDSQVMRLYRPDVRRFDPVAWPAELSEVRSRLEPARASVVATKDGSGTRDTVQSTIVLVRDPVVTSVPALILPLLPADPTHLSALAASLPRGLGQAFLVVQLDREAITSAILPSLAEEYLAGPTADGYRIAVVEAADRAKTLFSRGIPRGASLEPRSADVMAPLLSVRSGLRSRIADRLGVTPPATPAAPATATLPLPLPHAPEAVAGGRVAILVERFAKGDTVRVNARTTTGGGWQLVLQHPSGSLNAAVASARRRNLWISFGILAVLATGVALVVINARRSEHLASQQMDFVATVSHELRTPLAVIRSAAQNLSAGVVADPAKTRYYGELIENEGRRLTDMVEQVLEYAGLRGGRGPAAARPVDVAALLDDLVAAWSPEARSRGVEIRLDLAGRLSNVEADEDALRRAFDNLIANALKHGADGRWVGVTARAGRTRGRDEVQVTVSDRGTGIDPADAAHLFEPFYRGRQAVARQVPGNGLGLSLVRRIVEAHGGRVTVSSLPGQGASFTIHLPGRPAAAGEGAEALAVDAPG